jgi:8-oxo-dGTP pyrophosphatase MutT (NUDIX family)
MKRLVVAADESHIVGATIAHMDVGVVRRAFRIRISERSMAAQSGVIPFRFYRGDLQVLLVTSRRGKHWTIPKGHVEPDMSAAQSAMKEAFEEAGVSGAVGPACVGVYQYAKRKLLRRVEVFPMAVTRTHRTWPEMLTRRREWFGVDEAAELVAIERLGALIAALPEALADQALRETA